MNKLEQLEQLEEQKKEIEKQIRELKGTTNGIWVRIENVRLGNEFVRANEKNIPLTLSIRRSNASYDNKRTPKWANIGTFLDRNEMDIFITSLICNLEKVHEEAKGVLL